MEDHRDRGYILHVTPYGERDLIARVFTEQSGVLPMIAKGARGKYPKMVPLTPLMEAEIVYRDGRGDLRICHEVGKVEHYAPLRQSLPLLEAGSAMLRAVDRMLMPEKPAPLLYQLLNRYLEALTKTEEPATLQASFLLKLLKHEGCHPLRNCCAACNDETNLTVFFLSNDGTFCERHAPPYAVRFSETEAVHLDALTQAKQLSALVTNPVGPMLAHKVEQLCRQFS